MLKPRVLHLGALELEHFWAWATFPGNLIRIRTLTLKRGPEWYNRLYKIQKKLPNLDRKSNWLGRWWGWVRHQRKSRIYRIPKMKWRYTILKRYHIPLTVGSSCGKYPCCLGHNAVGFGGCNSGLVEQSTEKGNEHLANAMLDSSYTSPSGQYRSKI